MGGDPVSVLDDLLDLTFTAPVQKTHPSQLVDRASDSIGVEYKPCSAHLSAEPAIEQLELGNSVNKSLVLGDFLSAHRFSNTDAHLWAKIRCKRGVIM